MTLTTKLFIVDWPQAEKAEIHCCAPHMNLLMPLFFFVFFVRQQMAANSHGTIQICEAVNKYVCAHVCMSMCVFVCGCLLSTLFVSLMKGSGRARVKRDACWLRWSSSSSTESDWPWEAYEDGEREMEVKQTDRADSRREIDEGGAESRAGDGSICLLV